MLNAMKILSTIIISLFYKYFRMLSIWQVLFWAWRDMILYNKNDSDSKNFTVKVEAFSWKSHRVSISCYLTHDLSSPILSQSKNKSWTPHFPLAWHTFSSVKLLKLVSCQQVFIGHLLPARHGQQWTQSTNFYFQLVYLLVGDTDNKQIDQHTKSNASNINR